VRGVLLMAHGVARDVDDIPRYYAHIRHGQPLLPGVLAELEARYRAIGGHSPLMAVTESLARRVEQVLQADGQAVRVYAGFRHSPPFIGDVIQAMAADGVTEGVAITLAPHYSAFSTGLYIQAAEDGLAAAGHPFPLHFIKTWHREPGFIRLLADRVMEARLSLDEPARWRAPVIFTAHSLPERVRAVGDPYPDELSETARAVAEVLGISEWDIAWQSAGRTPEPWLKPDILDKMREVRQSGALGVLVCPCGFTADHLEVLYDLDIQAREVAQELGLAFARTRSLNDDPAFARFLAELAVREASAHA
jgi:ferrochelatase